MMNLSHSGRHGSDENHEEQNGLSREREEEVMHRAWVRETRDFRVTPGQQRNLARRRG